MYSTIRHVTVDSIDPYALALFWSAVLGVPLADDDEPGDPEALLQLPTFAVLFVGSPGSKSGKNRLHFDLSPEGGTRDEEIARLLALGAVVHEDHRRGDGQGWMTLRDPEGNEFCIERSAAERAAQEAS
jgi:catechol 2,3-dioxygenase-like lactoylglutathione lyase family enzyme